MYVTPRRFKHLGLGTDLSNVPDSELRSNLVRAAAQIESYCNVPLVPQRHSFKGGTITGERRSWSQDNYARRIYPFHTPIKAVQAMRVEVSGSLGVEFSTDDLYVQPVEGYIEVINFVISQVGIFGNANVPSLGLAQPVAVLDYTYGYEFEVVDELLQPIEAESGEDDFVTYMGAYGMWDGTADVIVRQGNVVLDPGDYSIDYDGGFIDLATPNSGDEDITADYVYTVPWEAQEANALAAQTWLGDRSLTAKGMTGLESLEVEEIRIRRIGSRSGAERGIALPESATLLLDGLVFMTVR